MSSSERERLVGHENISRSYRSSLLPPDYFPDFCPTRLLRSGHDRNNLRSYLIEPLMARARPGTASYANFDRRCRLRWTPRWNRVTVSAPVISARYLMGGTKDQRDLHGPWPHGENERPKRTAQWRESRWRNASSVKFADFSARPQGWRWVAMRQLRTAPDETGIFFLQDRD